MSHQRPCPFCHTPTDRVDTYYWRCLPCVAVFGDVTRAQSRNLVKAEICDCVNVHPFELFRYELVERPQLSMHQAGVTAKRRQGVAHSGCRRTIPGTAGLHVSVAGLEAIRRQVNGEPADV